MQDDHNRELGPTLHPNINDKVLLVQATLQWQIMGVKQSGSFSTGDIPSGAAAVAARWGPEREAKRARPPHGATARPPYSPRPAPRSSAIPAPVQAEPRQ